MGGWQAGTTLPPLLLVLLCPWIGHPETPSQTHSDILLHRDTEFTFTGGRSVNQFTGGWSQELLLSPIAAMLNKT